MSPSKEAFSDLRIGDLQAEIERLKGELEGTKIVYDKEYIAQYVKELKAEVAGLKCTLEISRQVAAANVGGLANAEAEIERLKEDLSHALSNRYPDHEGVCSGGSTCPWCEIERLKDQVIDYENHYSCKSCPSCVIFRSRLDAAVECAEGYTDILWTMEINDFANEILDKLRGES